MNKVLTYGELLTIVAEMVAYEIKKDPAKFSINSLYIPIENPQDYVDKRCADIRKAFGVLIIRQLLQKQETKAKVLLFKCISHKLDEVVKAFKREALYNHFKSWATIAALEEMRK